MEELFKVDSAWEVDC